MKKKVLLSLLSVLAFAVFGQESKFHYGLTLHGGVNRAKAMSNSSAKPIPNWGLGVGIQVRYFATEKFVVEINPRYLYNHVGFRGEFQGDNQTEYTHYFSYPNVEIPVLAGYFHPISENVQLSVWAGASLGRIIYPSNADVYIDDNRIWSGKGLSQSADKKYTTQGILRLLIDMPFRHEKRWHAGFEYNQSLAATYYYANLNSLIKPQFFSLMAGFSM
ncbi:MAG: outer membrane beta-barrel protein [Bacteroidia bacterium]